MLDWTAVASIAAALAAFLSWRQSQRSHLATIRPVLIFKDWIFNPLDKDGRVTFQAQKIENVGQGTGLFVFIRVKVHNIESELFSRQIISIAPKTELPPFKVKFTWPAEIDEAKISLWMNYSDAEANSYETRLEFKANRGSVAQHAKWTVLGYLPDKLELLSARTKLKLIPKWVQQMDEPKSYPDDW